MLLQANAKSSYHLQTMTVTAPSVLHVQKFAARTCWTFATSAAVYWGWEVLFLPSLLFDHQNCS